MSLISRLQRSRAALAAGTALLAGLLAAAPGASAQPHATDYAAIDADPALWRVSDADSDIYIFGTFHILPAELEWKTEDVMTAVEMAGTIYLEADVHSPEAQQQMQALIPQYGLNPAGTTLSSMLDEETQALLAEIAPSVGATPVMLDPMRPWLAQIVLAVGQMQQMGFDPNAGVELALISHVADRDMQFGYFETAEQQIGFLSGLPDDIQVRFLAEGLEDMERMPQLVDDMVRAWATGDMAALDALINDDMREDAPELFEAIIAERNRAWVPQILDILDGEGTVFIAVGAGHLPGDAGVIELLRDRGLTVTRQ
ncbi:TraB/GumN family protein [Maricaulis sp.]|uniref:TraB/GumN family protein n=1 Tax=Maricaulis sp. TaxID=1486257 RepID=UPI00261125E2|nr:TraB/GumN family protein [Maricaulis sp.]